jgi:hypothetical protein
MVIVVSPPLAYSNQSFCRTQTSSNKFSILFVDDQHFYLKHKHSSIKGIISADFIFLRVIASNTNFKKTEAERAIDELLRYRTQHIKWEQLQLFSIEEEPPETTLEVPEERSSQQIEAQQIQASLSRMESRDLDLLKSTEEMIKECLALNQLNRKFF